MKLSILVPAYNEEKRIVKALEQITSFNPTGWTKEIIVINDGSKDNTLKLINAFKNKIKIITYPINQGKGFAIRKGIEKATGNFILIQDADLEYNPKDIPKLLDKTKEFDAIYGSRFLGTHKGISKTHLFGNKFLSYSTSILYGQKITDMETGYKLIKTKIMKELKLVSNNFNIEPEITVKLLKKGIKIYEVPINYSARVKEEKKISVKDGFKALFYLIENRFSWFLWEILLILQRKNH